MAFIPLPNGIKVSVEFELAGQQVVITLWFKGSAPATALELNDLNVAILDWAQDELLPLLSTAITLTGATSTAQDSDSAPTDYNALTPAQNGAVSSDSIPNNVALVTSFLTALRGRSYRGRVYMPGLPANALSDAATVGSSLVTALAAAFAALSDVETITGLEHVVASHFTNGAPRTTAVGTPVEAYRTGSTLDSQRRRLPSST